MNNKKRQNPFLGMLALIVIAIVCLLAAGLTRDYRKIRLR